jgi:DNA-binding NtrC family response regulator
LEQAVTEAGPRGYGALPPLPKPLLQLLRRSPITVFVMGGSEEHREQAARKLHQESIVHDGPFVRVDCVAEQEGLHHALGAWLAGTPGDLATDPVARANGGTLYLESIEQLSGESQRLLLGLALQRNERGSYPGHPRWAARLIVGNVRDLTSARDEGRFHVALHDLVDQFRVTLE